MTSVEAAHDLQGVRRVDPLACAQCFAQAFFDCAPECVCGLAAMGSLWRHRRLAPVCALFEDDSQRPSCPTRDRDRSERGFSVTKQSTTHRARTAGADRRDPRPPPLTAEPGRLQRQDSAGQPEHVPATFPSPDIIGWALDRRFDLVDVEAQRVIVQQLHEIGVDARALVLELGEDEDLAGLVDELRAAQQEARWRAIEPYHHRFWETFDALTAAMTEQKVEVPAEVRALFVDFMGALSLPARALDLHDADESPALPAAPEVTRRGRPGSLTTRIKQMHATDDRSLLAIRQRFMPHVRRTVAARIQSALRARETLRPPPPKGHVDTPQQVSRRLNRPTYNLTAAFLRAFYPWLGADTTAELVRRSL